MDQRPIRSIIAMICPCAGVAVCAFLTTAQGRRFNEDVFGRYDTAGAILMPGAYGTFFTRAVHHGVVSSRRASTREERPPWLARLALALTLLPLVATLLHRSYF